ncbi:MAG: hypothetical protein AAGF99_17165 [Bacteroidota bacterium]
MPRCLFLALLILLVAVPARAQDPAPAVVYPELLEFLDVDDEDGRFQLPNFVIAFSQADRAQAVLRDGTGDTVWSRAYQAQRDGTRTATRFIEAPSSGGIGGFFGRDKSEPPVFDASGDYVLEIEQNDEVVTRFPFRVERIESDDPYADTPPRYALLGPWQTVGFAQFEGTDTVREPVFEWNYFTQVLDPERERVSYEQVRWELRRDGRLIARTVTSDQATESRALRTQQFQRVQTHHTDGNAVLRRDDFSDGTYEVRRVVNADAYNGGAFTQTATFDIRDGRFVPVGAQVREGTPPDAFIEGLNRAFVYPITTTR